MQSLFVRLPARRLLALLALVLTASCGGRFDDAPFSFSTTLNGAEEVPAVASAGTGAGLVTADPSGRSLRASVVVTGIAATAVALQDGAPGVNGPVVLALQQEASGAWTARADIGDAQLNALRAGRYYFNVSSAARPTGELRGQLGEQLPSSQQLELLAAALPQSPLIDEQFHQIRDIEDARDFPRSWSGVSLFIGF